MRTILDFTVTGSSRDELIERAEKFYSAFTGKDQKLPHNATMTISVEEEVTRQGVTIATTWAGHVEVSELQS